MASSLIPRSRTEPSRLPRGGVMSVQTVSLGWHWLTYRYSRTGRPTGPTLRSGDPFVFGGPVRFAC